MIDFRKKDQVMGILNVTPDSFSDGGQHFGLRSDNFRYWRPIYSPRLSRSLG